MKKDIWTEFSDKLVQSLEKRPPGEGWMTVHDVMKRFKKTRAAANKFLCQNADKIDRFRGVIMGVNGKLICCMWYRPKR